MFNLSLTIEGATEEDIEVAMEEVLRLLKDGFTSGLGSNESGSYSFTVQGNPTIHVAVRPAGQAPVVDSQPVAHPDSSTPTAATVEAYRDAAHRIWHDDGRIEIDDSPEISRGCDSGAYVQAWVWVYDSDLEAPAGPSYDVWIAEREDLGVVLGGHALSEWQWSFDARFTCEDDPDGKGARRSAHEHARGLRKGYPEAFVAVRQSSKGMPPIPRGANG
jgi:hypothetical protein